MATSNQATERAQSLAPAVTRAAAILDLLALVPTEALGTSALARRLALPKSSVSNICGALVAAGLLSRSGSGYTLGRRLAELGGAYLAGVDEVRAFYRACDELEVASQETMQLGVLDGLEVIYIARHDGSQPVHLASEIGRRLPATCTALGKAALASLPHDELDRRLVDAEPLPVLTPRSHRTVTALLADLEKVRKRGYAIDDEETAPGIVCYAVALPAVSIGSDRHAASVSLVKVGTDDERRAALAGDLLRLTEMMGYQLRPAAESSS
ncbi:MAG: IclR family transcriptional regulator [Acidimicrobiia bacterium]|jgi:DNA-binding IclR family transcriptional regulator